MEKIPGKFRLPRDEEGSYYTPSGTPLERPPDSYLPEKMPMQSLYPNRDREAWHDHSSSWTGTVMAKGAFLTQERSLGPRVGSDSIAMTFQYNPTTLRITRNLEYGSIDTPGTTFPATYFKGAKPDKLEFTLFLEAKTKLEGNTPHEYFDGIAPEIAALYSLTQSDEVMNIKAYNPIINRPPRVILSLGPKFTLDVWVANLEIEIREWSPKLIPLRATVDVVAITVGNSKLPRTIAWLNTLKEDAYKHVQEMPDIGEDLEKLGSTSSVRRSGIN
jgi:hypothetical protein